MAKAIRRGKDGAISSDNMLSSLLDIGEVMANNYNKEDLCLLVNGCVEALWLSMDGPNMLGQIVPFYSSLSTLYDNKCQFNFNLLQTSSAKLTQRTKTWMKSDRKMDFMAQEIDIGNYVVRQKKLPYHVFYLPAENDKQSITEIIES